MNRRTPLYQQHVDGGAKMIDFFGWEMPLAYGSQIAEHKTVREHAGVFDVSHMTVVDIGGAEAKRFLQTLLANDVGKLDEPGRALYSAMLNERGGVIDDLIVYRLEQGYRAVVNCATREKDLAWIDRQSGGFQVSVRERDDLAILAVHGPASIDAVCALFTEEEAERIRALRNFRGTVMGDWFVARTGYTGEKGLELIIPSGDAPSLWDRLLAQGVLPVGLGARDTLRLEAGMNLYGQDMDEDTSPLAAGMDVTISWEPEDRDFLGREAVAEDRRKQREGLLPQLRGLVLEGRGVLRRGQKVLCDKGEGIITSGGFSPVLSHSIALARLPAGSERGEVDIRGNRMPIRIVQPNFVRFGKKVFE